MKSVKSVKSVNSKRACLVINPHAGQNVTKLADVLAVLAAAGWETDIRVKEYGGQSMEMAAEAAKANYDLVIGYGGDGTLNQVLNGVMSARKQSSIIGVIPGGTVNVWAAEIGVSTDPVRAALTLCNSEARKIDVGYVEVEGLSLPGAAQDAQGKPAEKKGKQGHKKEVSGKNGAKHHFLLMAGLGFDAAVMEHVSKSFKYRVGRLAPVLSAVEELPRQHSFPIEIRVAGTEEEDEKIWKGKALQVIVGNTRRYGAPVELTPEAYLDDGLLEVCVITAGNLLATLEQIASLLFRRKPDNITTEHFRGASISISVPASIALQLDGSAVRLKDYLNKANRKALKATENLQDVMVTYRFDAMPRAVQVAIPSDYHGPLFEKAPVEEQQVVATKEHMDGHGEAEQASPELVTAILAHGHHMTVRGVTSRPGKKETYIIAGMVAHHLTGDSTPAALRVREDVMIIRRSGEPVSHEMLSRLQEGEQVVAVGKKSKYGVIRATHIMI